MTISGTETRPDALAPQDGAAALGWALCVATLNRIDVLELCVRCALAQTRKPLEVVIVDASDDWEAHGDRIRRLTDSAAIPLIYLPAERKSSAVQRNQGIRAATADVLFLIDDDSLLYPDAADLAMRLYEGPHGGDIVALGLKSQNAPPVPVPGDMVRKGGTREGKTALGLTRFPLFSWLYREVFLLTLDRLFFEYTAAARSVAQGPSASFEQNGAYITGYLGGYYLTARREIAIAEPFNPYLLGYSPLEDLDAIYRWRQHGHVVQSTAAHVYHHETGQSRIDRRRVTQLQLTNSALFVRLNSVRLGRDAVFFAGRLLRRCVAEFLKDAGTRRFAFPQLRGALAAIPGTVRLLTMPASEIVPWYEEYQSMLLWGTRVPPPAPGEQNHQPVGV